MANPLRAVVNSYDDSWRNTQYNTTEGTEFWVTFMSNSGAAEGDMETMKLYLYATAREDTRVTIHNPNGYSSEYFDVQAGKQASFQVKNEWAYINTKEANTITNRGVRITSEKPISLYATNQHKSGKYDATNVLPTTALMGEYVIQTYRADVYATEFAIVATSNQNVTIKIKKTTIDQDKYNNGIIDTVGIPEEYTIYKYFYPGQTYLFRATEKLDGGNNIETSTSLSGTTICSDSPLAVFVGGQSAKISADPENHIFSQAYPTDKWGKSFYVTPTYGMVYDFVQFTACKNNTQIRKDGTLIATINAKESYIDTLKSVLQYIDDDADDPTYTPVPALYTTTNPTECYLYGTGYYINHPLKPNGKENTKEYTPYGAPVLTPIIPQELAMKSTMFATFTKTNTEMSHYVNIVTPTVEVGGMRLDNVNISTEFKPIAGTDYSFLIKEITNTAHKIENVRNNSNSTFTARVYGLGASTSAKESYAYAVGSRVSRKADVLVNGQYIKEKSICITQSLTFKGLVEGDYTSVDWDFKDHYGSTSGSTFEKTHKFGSAGDYEVEFIVKRPFPYLCSSGYGSNNYVYDRVSVLVHVKDKYYADFHRKICEGESVTLTGYDENGVMQTYTYSSNYSETKQMYTVEGCDSIVNIKIEVGKPETKEITESACEQYTWHNVTYKESGRYEWQDLNEYGCTRTEYLNLTIKQPVVGEPEKITICANSALDWNGRHITSAGTYTAHLNAANGCDSLATIIVSVEKEYKEEKSVKLCHGETYKWRNKTLSVADTYTDKSLSPLGCDSTFILHLSFQPDYSDIQIAKETCEDRPYWFYDEYLKKSGTYTKHLKTKYGDCDSIVTLTLTVWPLEYDTIRASICDGETYLFDGKQLRKSGEYKKIEKNPHGCTKTTVLYLTVNSPTHRYDTIRTCEQNMPYTYLGKYTINKPGDTKWTLEEKNKAGCDSICHLHLIVDKTIITPIYVKWCDYMGAYSHPDPNTPDLHNLTETCIRSQTLKTANGCDSIVELHLNVGKRTYYNMSVNVCDTDLPWKDPNQPALELSSDTTYNDTISNKAGCDSIITVTFKVHKTYNKTIDISVCDKELPYNHPDTRFTKFQKLYSSGTYTQTVKSVHGCDSMITLNLTVNPTTYNHQYIKTCSESLPYIYGDHKKEAWKEDVYRDTLNTPNQFGCDSILVVHLTIMETIIDRQTVVLCDDDLPYNHPDSRATKLQNLRFPDTYIDTIKSVSTGCDSIIELHLYVKERSFYKMHVVVCEDELPWKDPNKPSLELRRDTTYNDTIVNKVGCDSIITVSFHVNKTFNKVINVFVCDNQIPYYHSDERFTKFQGLTNSGIYTQTIPTLNDCDSTVTLNLTINPVTYNHQYVTVCEEKLPYVYGDHGKEAWKDSVYKDTLNTANQFGCDSVLVVHFSVLKTVIDRQKVVLCDNEIPYNHPDDRALKLQNLRITGLYYDTIEAVTGCDSIIELDLTVWPTYETDDVRHACDNETVDFNGHIFENLLPSDTPYRMDTMLTSVHGCDSLVHLSLTVSKSYLFPHQERICSGEVYSWRDGIYNESGVYYDSLTTQDGCDSVYALELYKKPLLLITTFDTICDDERYEHIDTLWYTNNTHSLVNTLIWEPGMKIPQSYTDVIFRSIAEDCDSIIYRYYLSIQKTYLFQDTAQICSNEPIEIRGIRYTGYEFEYEPGDYHAPFDTLMRITYSTATGCDSVFELYATIYPAYRHADYMTICENEVLDWEGQHFEGLKAGDYVFRSENTTIFGCDSIYELQLHVTPAWFYEETQTKCADDDFSWHGLNLSNVPPGSYFYYDSAKTVTYGCDSVYHLYLTVIDTTSEVNYDSICWTDTLFVGTHQYTQPGHYIDTVYNEWGCSHYVHTYLAVIDPTVPKAWVDSICADDSAYELFYTYTGHDPVAYSVYYDEEGHLYGFEDVIDEPITRQEELSVLTIPMPLRDNDSTKYPKPNYYNIRLVLDNGICIHKELCTTDTSVVLSYPSWITRQRFGDAIALYNEKYNGGYYWSSYQWYHGDTLLVGETHEYLYIPSGLVVGDQYHVRLTRVGETIDFQTCPITIVKDPIINDFSPTMKYLSVVPTCIVTGHPIAYILSRKGGKYRITTIQGSFVEEGHFEADVTEVELPSILGMYIVQLWSPETPEEPYRNIKVLVSDKCETCNTPF